MPTQKVNSWGWRIFTVNTDAATPFPPKGGKRRRPGRDRVPERAPCREMEPPGRSFATVWSDVLMGTYRLVLAKRPFSPKRGKRRWPGRDRVPERAPCCEMEPPGGSFATGTYDLTFWWERMGWCSPKDACERDKEMRRWWGLRRGDASAGVGGASLSAAVSLWFSCCWLVACRWSNRARCLVYRKWRGPLALGPFLVALGSGVDRPCLRGSVAGLFVRPWLRRFVVRPPTRTSTTLVAVAKVSLRILHRGSVTVEDLRPRVSQVHSWFKWIQT
jgi:hypothetical protein